MALKNRKATIFIASETGSEVRFGKFPLQHDEAGAFVILPSDTKVYLSEELIRPGKAVGADFVYAMPLRWSRLVGSI